MIPTYAVNPAVGKSNLAQSGLLQIILYFVLHCVIYVFKALQAIDIKAKFVQPLINRFQIDLGCDADDLALHFNPRFHDDTDGAVLVCNSKIAGCWGDEKREIHNPLQRGADVKVRECDRRN